MAKKKTQTSTPTTAAPVTSYKHDSKRARIPTQEESAILPRQDKKPVKKIYSYDPSLDPQLVWSGKHEEGSEFDVPTVPIYVQEHVSPEAIIARLKAGASDDRQLMLFGETAEEQIHKAVEFYKHEDNWQNRLILGDSLVAMNSLIEKEGMRDKVQTIYFDPPYGIKFGSNWQVSTRNRDVKNTLNDFVRQPEQVKAFRDTWELGIHSYLTYLRERLVLSRELLNVSGSCFVQISDENIHLVRNLMDEVFGPENFVSLITFRKKFMSLGAQYLDSMCDYIIFYCKDKSKLKYRTLFQFMNVEGDNHWNAIELPDGTRRKATKEEINNHKLLPKGARIFQLSNLYPAGINSSGLFEIEFGGKKYFPPKGNSWKTNHQGMMNLISKKRVEPYESGDTLRYVLFLDDYPVTPIDNIWDKMPAPSDKIYAVQTTREVIQRCILMSSDPGDIVLDPTCGSGTTALVAEQWGRRWITLDTSRVALALARTRLMTHRFPYYSLKDSGSVSSGFEYETVPHVTLKSLANNEQAEREVLYDKPRENKSVVRVAGPFTVESLSPHRVSDAQEMVSTEHFVNIIIENMLKAGIQTGEKSARVDFVNLDILPSGPEVQAVGEYKTEQGFKKVAVAVGPEFGSVDDDFIRDAISVASRFADLLIIAATSFEASAHSVPNQVEDLRIMKVKINPDLSMGDLLKKTGSGNLFLAFGEPDIKVMETSDGYCVEILGVDVYDPVKSEIRTSGSGNPDHDIAAWFIDTNYNSEAFFISHAYFLGKDKPYEKLKKALKADINPDLWDELYSTKSRLFPKPKSGKIAVKVINHYGDEVMKVVEIE